MSRISAWRTLLPVVALLLAGAIACSSDSGDAGSSEGARLTAAEIALATAQADISGSAPTGSGGLSAADVLQRAGQASATLESVRFTTEIVVTQGDDVQISTTRGEWTLPGRYRGIPDSPDDPTEEFIVADGRLIYRERGTDIWRVESEYDQALGIGSGQIIPGMEIFEFSDPEDPDNGEFYRITGAQNVSVPGLEGGVVQTHELAIRLSDFHVESVVSFINPDQEIGLGGTRRAFVVYDRNVPEPIVLPEVVLPAAD